MKKIYLTPSVSFEDIETAELIMSSNTATIDHTDDYTEGKNSPGYTGNMDGKQSEGVSDWVDGSDF